VIYQHPVKRDEEAADRRNRTPAALPKKFKCYLVASIHLSILPSSNFGPKGKLWQGIFLTGFRKRVKLGPENGFMPGCEKAS